MAKQNASQNGAFQNGSLDIAAIVASQKKNIEALAQANQIAVGGAQKVISRQITLATETLDECSAMISNLFQPNGSSENWLSKQAEFSRHAVEKGLANTREIVETVSQVNTQAFDVIGKRITEALYEVGAYANSSLAAERRNPA